MHRKWRPGQHYFVYIAGSLSGTLYVGMTNDLHHRMWQHKYKELEGFTAQYDVNRLLYYESLDDVRDAINREKQIKRWRRDKKVWLIERMNPKWEDLSRGWYDRGPSTHPR